MTHHKSESLASEIARIYNSLARKGEVLGHAKINPENFELSVFLKDGTYLPKERFSAGERQLLAISSLWALSKLSGKNLPVVIDTPLGRLDSEHRRALITRYFPNASHQVIILSTDEEVDEEFFKLISPHTLESYHLNYNTKTRATEVTRGYFWEK